MYFLIQNGFFENFNLTIQKYLKMSYIKNVLNLIFFK